MVMMRAQKRDFRTEVLYAYGFCDSTVSRLSEECHYREPSDVLEYDHWGYQQDDKK